MYLRRLGFRGVVSNLSGIFGSGDEGIGSLLATRPDCCIRMFGIGVGASIDGAGIKSSPFVGLSVGWGVGVGIGVADVGGGVVWRRTSRGGVFCSSGFSTRGFGLKRSSIEVAIILRLLYAFSHTEYWDYHHSIHGPFYLTALFVLSHLY